jgi:hypothetical protein
VAAQYCRYLFYVGTIRTIQLEYTEAKEVLQQAARKAPTCAHGFRVTCNKWLILVGGASIRLRLYTEQGSRLDT